MKTRSLIIRSSILAVALMLVFGLGIFTAQKVQARALDPWSLLPMQTHQTGETEEVPPIDVNSLITWLMAAGSPAIVVAFLSEHIPAFQKLSGGHKVAVIVAIGGGLTAGGSVIRYVILQMSPDAVDLLNTGIFAAFYLAVFFGVSQWFHLTVNQKLKLSQQLRQHAKSLPDALRAAGASETLIRAAELVAAALGALELPGEGEPLPTGEARAGIASKSGRTSIG